MHLNMLGGAYAWWSKHVCCDVDDQQFTDWHHAANNRHIYELQLLTACLLLLLRCLQPN